MDSNRSSNIFKKKLNNNKKTLEEWLAGSYKKKPEKLNSQAFFVCDHDWIRTSTPCSTTPSRWRVYQFLHTAIILCDYSKGLSEQHLFNKINTNLMLILMVQI